jgi:hypothetical protein
MSPDSVSGPNRVERLSEIATSYSEARDRVFMSVSACRSDRYELIAASVFVEMRPETGQYDERFAF